MAETFVVHRAGRSPVSAAQTAAPGALVMNLDASVTTSQLEPALRKCREATPSVVGESVARSTIGLDGGLCQMTGSLHRSGLAIMEFAKTWCQPLDLSEAFSLRKMTRTVALTDAGRRVARVK